MADVNKGSYKVTKSGAVRQAGVLPAGDNATSRGATARAGTLASNSGDGGGPAHWYTAYSHTGSPVGTGKSMPQKFKPTTKGGKVRGGGG